MFLCLIAEVTFKEFWYVKINFVILAANPQRGQTVCNEIKLNQVFEKNRVN